MSIPSATANVTDLMVGVAATFPDRNLYVRRSGSGSRGVGAGEVLERVRWLARGLVAAGLGVGERVAILSPGSYESCLAALATWYAGGVSVPIADTQPRERIAGILVDSGATRIFVGRELTDLLADVLRAPARPDSAGPDTPGPDTALLAERLIPVTTLALEGEGGTLATLAGPGQGVSDTELERHRAAAHLDSPATIVYRDAADLPLESRVVTHEALIGLARRLLPRLEDPTRVTGPRAVVDLPPSHEHAQATLVACLAADATLVFTSTADLLQDLSGLRPTFVLGPPQLFEDVYDGALAQAAHSHRSGLFARGASTARAYAQALDDAASGPGERTSRRLRLAHAVFERLVYRRVRGMFGGSLETALCSGGPLSPDLSQFFRGIGVEIVDAESVIDGGALYS